jgi:hypothetical protein
MRFFLKSIDVWKIVETGWIKPKETDEILLFKQAQGCPMTKLSMQYVMHN